jgi:hypothetical protein
VRPFKSADGDDDIHSLDLGRYALTSNIHYFVRGASGTRLVRGALADIMSSVVV